MRQRVFVYSAVLVTAALGCRKKTNEVGQNGETPQRSRGRLLLLLRLRQTPPPVPATAASINAKSSWQSIRQELAGIDQQI